MFKEQRFESIGFGVLSFYAVVWIPIELLLFLSVWLFARMGAFWFMVYIQRAIKIQATNYHFLTIPEMVLWDELDSLEETFYKKERVEIDGMLAACSIQCRGQQSVSWDGQATLDVIDLDTCHAHHIVQSQILSNVSWQEFCGCHGGTWQRLSMRWSIASLLSEPHQMFCLPQHDSQTREQLHLPLNLPKEETRQ
jgi:hypothetical protein